MPVYEIYRTKFSLRYKYCLYMLLRCLCNDFDILYALVGCLSSVFIRKVIYKYFNVCAFHYTAFTVSEKVGIP